MQIQARVSVLIHFREVMELLEIKVFVIDTCINIIHILQLC